MQYACIWNGECTNWAVDVCRCTAVQNPVPRLITVNADHSADLFLPDTDKTIDHLLDHVASSGGLCVVETTNYFYWIDDVTGTLTAYNYTSRVSMAIIRLCVWFRDSVCPHDKTKTKIAKLGTEIVHHDTSPTNYY